MAKNPVLDVSLSQVMRPEIALPLGQILQIYTVGSFLSAWANPKNHQYIERIFDSPQQARHAAAVCAAWLGVRAALTTAPLPINAWWHRDEVAAAPLA